MTDLTPLCPLKNQKNKKDSTHTTTIIFVMFTRKYRATDRIYIQKCKHKLQVYSVNHASAKRYKSSLKNIFAPTNP